MCPKGLKRPPNTQCDEYPFASTSKGGTKLPPIDRAREWVPRHENQKQRVILSGFYRNNRILRGSPVMPSTSGFDGPEGKYGWLDEWFEANLGEALTLTLARISSPEAFLKAIGARSLPGDEGTLSGVTALADGNGHEHVLVGVIPAPGKPGWVLAAESPSHVGYLKASELSVKGDVVALCGTEDGGVSFVWAKAASSWPSTVRPTMMSAQSTAAIRENWRM